jgi:hypothetical protein
MTKTPGERVDKLKAELTELAASIADLTAKAAPIEKQLKSERAKRDRRIRKAVEGGMTAAEAATLAGVSRQFVAALAPARATRRAATDPTQRTATVAAEVRPESDILLIPAVADPIARTPKGDIVRSSFTSRRYAARLTAWADHRTGAYVLSNGQRGSFPVGDMRSAEHILAGLPPEVTRVYLMGRRPGGEFAAEHESEAAAVRAWFYAAVPGWEVSGTGHYLRDVDTPTGRWHPTHNPSRRVEVNRCASWLPEEVTDPNWAFAAMNHVALLIAQEFDGATWLSTPATTGRDLWARTIPDGESYPVLSTEIRELIHSTAGQGRTEMVEADTSELPGFVYLDGRVMYSALTWGMPVGVPRMWTGSEFAALDEKAQASRLMDRGRWRVRATVPPDWAHPGILMAPAVDGGWTYPREPGRTFTTWAGATLVDLARRHGWHVEVTEGLTWAEGKPLDTWTKKLLRCWTSADEAEQTSRTNGDHAMATVAKAAKHAFRSMIIFSIGAFATRAHVTSGAVPLDRPDLVPEGATVRREGQRLIWERADQGGSWTLRMAHPEWSATIWERSQGRLLSGPAVAGQRTGILHLPPEHYLGARTDGLYLTTDPGWADDGRVGRFRIKGKLTGPVPTPHTWAELYRLRDKAEAEVSR